VALASEHGFPNWAAYPNFADSSTLRNLSI